MTVNYAIRESEGKSFRWGQPVLVGQLSLNVSSLRFSVEAKNLRAKYGSEGSLSEFSAGRNYSNAATPQKPTKKNIGYIMLCLIREFPLTCRAL